MDVTQGHHGTFYTAAVQILKEGFRISPKPDQYWGDGIYFFEASGELRTGEQYAIEWIKGKKWREKIQDGIAVILSSIEVGECLNLDYQPHRDLVAEMRKNLVARGVPEDTVTTPVAINALADVLNTDTVRLTYESKPEGKLFTGSRLYKRVSLILCVRNLKKILSTVICYKES